MPPINRLWVRHRAAFLLAKPFSTGTSCVGRAHPGISLCPMVVDRLSVASWISPKVRKGDASPLQGRGLFAVEPSANR